MIVSEPVPAVAGSCWSGGLDFTLPEELIAQSPAARRDGSRLMVVDRSRGSIAHRHFYDFVDALGAKSLLVANDSRVFPARLMARKPSGGKVELLLLAPGGRPPVAAMFKTGKGLREGQVLDLADGSRVRVVGPVGGGRCGLDFGARTAEEVLSELGSVPLPPYIKRPQGATESDRERYQTVYAREPGSVAAPTAGLHFSDAMLEDLASAGHSLVTVTLHVGPGTFTPVRGELCDHVMEGERFSIGEAAAAAINEARAAGRRVVAVGTTTVRALESAAAGDRSLAAAGGDAGLFIRPGHRFRVVDALLTNFHLPGSTLLALVMALAGEDLIRRAYDEAVAERYRFYSYGDAMLLI